MISRRSILTLLALALPAAACAKPKPAAPIDGLMQDSEAHPMLQIPPDDWEIDVGELGGDTIVWFITWGDGTSETAYAGDVLDVRKLPWMRDARRFMRAKVTA